MLTPENCTRLCDDCPERYHEGSSHWDPVTGDLVVRRPNYINANFEFVSDPSETPDVDTQEFGVRFVDTEGNATSPLWNGTQLEDIAKCEGPVVTQRYGFLRRKKHYDCGAHAVRLSEFRERMKEPSSYWSI